MTEERFLTVKQFITKFSWPTESGLRALILRAKEKGLERAFKRIGRRVLIDVTEFWRVIERGEQDEQV
ncbi:MAG: hypothetical protein WCN87_01730 [Chlamydiota bacterium]